MAVPEVLVVLDSATALRIAPRIGRIGDGRVAILLRDREASARAIVEAARALRPLAGCLFVSDRADVALCAGADGVHLPERGLTVADARVVVGGRMLVGASRHDAAGVAGAVADGADYATVSPIWQSPGKADPLGLEGLERAVAVTHGKVLALGGVTAERAADAVRAGAHGVAVARAVSDASDPAAALVAILASLDDARRPLVDRDR